MTGLCECLLLHASVAVLPIGMHVIPIPVNSTTHLIPEQNLVQNVVRFHTGT